MMDFFFPKIMITLEFSRKYCKTGSQDKICSTWGLKSLLIMGFLRISFGEGKWRGREGKCNFFFSIFFHFEWNLTSFFLFWLNWRNGWEEKKENVISESKSKKNLSSLPLHFPLQKNPNCPGWWAIDQTMLKTLPLPAAKRGGRGEERTLSLLTGLAPQG